MHEMQETQVWSLGREDPLEEGMVIHSSILAWRIPWTQGPGGLQVAESDTTEEPDHAHTQVITEVPWKHPRSYQHPENTQEVTNMELITHILKNPLGRVVEQKPYWIDEWMRIEEVETTGVDCSFTKHACEVGEKDSTVSEGEWEFRGVVFFFNYFFEV